MPLNISSTYAKIEREKNRCFSGACCCCLFSFSQNLTSRAALHALTSIGPWNKINLNRQTGTDRAVCRKAQFSDLSGIDGLLYGSGGVGRPSISDDDRDLHCVVPGLVRHHLSHPFDGLGRVRTCNNTPLSTPTGSVNSDTQVSTPIYSVNGNTPVSTPTHSLNSNTQVSTPTHSVNNKPKCQRPTPVSTTKPKCQRPTPVSTTKHKCQHPPTVSTIKHKCQRPPTVSTTKHNCQHCQQQNPSVDVHPQCQQKHPIVNAHPQCQ